MWVLSPASYMEVVGEAQQSHLSSPIGQKCNLLVVSMEITHIIRYALPQKSILWYNIRPLNVLNHQICSRSTLCSSVNLSLAPSCSKYHATPLEKSVPNKVGSHRRKHGKVKWKLVDFGEQFHLCPAATIRRLG